ncbi:MAG TPA: flagellar biosynthesis anti-sigma factor FlgM [Labilithrix sp.]|nr:flagellar biosynthesis anti-sigma factor FlgM [Labilithrix sp.]
MRITDRYQGLMDRVAPGAAKAVDKTEKSEQGSSAAKAKPKATGGALEVSVSDRAQELAAGTARLEELRNAIKDGSFKVDSKAIASKLVGLLGDE